MPPPRVSGRWSAFGWSVVQLDHDKEMGPMRGVFGTLYTELEAQRTIKGAGTAHVPERLMLTTKESQMGCGEEKK